MSKKAQKVAETILRLRRDKLNLVKRDNKFTADEHKMHWLLNAASQPYNDCLEAMKRGKLISDYNLVKDTAKE